MTPARLLTAAALSVAVATALFAADPKADTTRLPPPSAKTVDFDNDVRPILAANCFKCHGPEKQKGGLRLDDRATALEGGNSGPGFATGKSAESRLIHAVAGLPEDGKMPPSGPGLTAEQVGTLRAWIDQGANWGTRAGPAAVAAPAKSDHWSFQPIRRPAVPAVADPTHVARNPIDHFVLARLAQEGVRPSPEADRTTLLRRVHLDLIGLPPTPAEVDAFLTDPAADAYERAVDRLLASRHYGERWARHWLDAARYADSDGYEKDAGRPHAWRYREWVVNALNADMPFDRFTVEQLAGDLLPDAAIEQKTATGFHRNTLTNREGGVDQEEFRVAACVDRVNTTGAVWLGLTVGCCQCHDHKFDPLSQREYYQLFAYFDRDREADLDAPLPGEAALGGKRAAFDAETERLKAEVTQAKTDNLPADDVRKREQKLAAHQKKVPTTSKVMTLAAGPPKATHLMIRGDFLRKGVEVSAGTPAVVRPVPATPAGPGTRLDLARWLVSQDNPLPARVTVNWVWLKLFGRGIVPTPEDFGTQGGRPSHPDLLDWLAAEFKGPNQCGWSLKRLNRLVVTSATYRQSSAVTPGRIARDPLNVLLARQARLRLEAEVVRDGALAASGLLTRTVGGPSVRPPQPAGVSELTYANAAKWVESTGPDRYRRGMYIWFQRTSPYPMLMAFDSPDSNVCTVRRERSNTPLQALTLLNDAVFVEAAQALAKRVLTEKPDAADGDRAGHAFRLCLGRGPTRGEAERLAGLLKRFRSLAATPGGEAAKLVGPHRPAGVPAAEAAAWVALARTLLNLDEFATRE